MNTSLLKDSWKSLFNLRNFKRCRRKFYIESAQELQANHLWRKKIMIMLHSNFKWFEGWRGNFYTYCGFSIFREIQCDENVNEKMSLWDQGQDETVLWIVWRWFVFNCLTFFNCIRLLPHLWYWYCRVKSFCRFHRYNGWIVSTEDQLCHLINYTCGRRKGKSEYSNWPRVLNSIFKKSPFHIWSLCLLIKLKYKKLL